MTKKLAHPTVFDFKDFQTNDEEWERLELAGGVTLSVELRKRLFDVIEDYQFRKYVIGTAATPKAVNKVLNGLSYTLHLLDSQLCRLLELGESTSAAAHKEIRHWSLHNKRPYKDLSDLNRFHDQVRDFLNSVDLAKRPVDKNPSNPGRPGDLFIGVFLMAVLDIFHEAGGKSKTGPKALAFLENACRVSGYPAHSLDALKQSLKPSVQGKKNRRGP